MNEVLVSKIFNYTSTPTKNVEGQFWFNPSTNVLSRFNGTVWKPITVSSDDVAVLTDGSKVSLTNYLNTQIAALAEGIDSKQDKLKYYSETSGATPSATISVGNIKLEGSVAEGGNTKALGSYSHSEGDNTKTLGSYSHSEGLSTTALGDYSHVEGSGTTALGDYSHVEGSGTTTSGQGSHAEGYYTEASSNYQHVQGKYNIEDANDKYADIIGNGSSESARSNAATVSWEGISWSKTDVRAGGTDQDNAIHSLSNKQNILEYIKEKQGENNVDTIITTAVGDPDGAETAGNVLITTGKDQASGGKITITTAGGTSSGGSSKNIDINTGNTAYGTGDINISTGTSQFSTSGDINLTTGECADAGHLCGNINLKAGGINGNPGNINIETQNTGSITLKGGTGHLIKILEDGIILNSGNNVVDNCGLATGNQTTASGWYSHTEGFFTTASGDSSHAEGIGTTASSENQHVQGKYNIIDNDNVYANIIGNGASDTIRNNAQTVSWTGITWSQTDVRAGGTDQDSAAHSLSNKQDKLAFYHEDLLANPPEASIENVNSFLIQNVTKGLILDNSGGITIETSSFDAGKGVISIANNVWEDNSDPILFDIDGNSIKISDALLIPKIKNKQDSTSIDLNTTDKTIVGAINEVNTALNTKADSLLYYSETSGDTPSATISVANIKLNGRVAEGTNTTASGIYSHAEGNSTTASGNSSHAEGQFTTASSPYSHAEGGYTTASGPYQHTQGKFNIKDANGKYADIIGNGSSIDARSNAATVSWNGISWSQSDVRAGGTDQDSAAHSLSAKQNSTDTALNTTNKTIVGAINEINSIFNVNALPTPITDVKTITTTLENLITDTQYANKPGTILINPAITNTGAILVGENITDLNKAFPIYTDQPVTIAFKNINNFKVAGNAAGDKFNYIISFGYINQNITSDSLAIATANGVYTITPTGNAGSETITISKIS